HRDTSVLSAHRLVTRTSRTMSRMRRLACVALALLSAGSVLAAGDPPLVDAARNGDRAAVRALLGNGADPNAAAPDGSTPVHWAVHRDDLEMLDVLLDAGARPDTLTRYTVAPLTLAAQNGSAALIERLLDA